MNRRSFLSFLSVAPVALPMAAKNAAAQSAFASGGYVHGISSVTFGLDASRWTDWSVPCRFYGSTMRLWDGSHIEPSSPADGVDLAELSQSFDAVPQTINRVQATLGNFGQTINKVVDLVAKIPNEIEAQMRDDDLFQLDSSVIGEGVPQTALSPETEKQNEHEASI